MTGNRPLTVVIAILLAACSSGACAQQIGGSAPAPAAAPASSCKLHIITGGHHAYNVSEDVLGRISRLSNNSGVNIDGYSIIISALDGPAQTAILRDVDWPSLLPIAGPDAVFFNEEFALDKLAPQDGCTFTLSVRVLNYTGGMLGMGFAFNYTAAGSPGRFEHDGSHSMTLGPEFATRDGNTIVAVDNLMREFRTGATDFAREARVRMAQGPRRRR